MTQTIYIADAYPVLSCRQWQALSYVHITPIYLQIHVHIWQMEAMAWLCWWEDIWVFTQSPPITKTWTHVTYQPHFQHAISDWKTAGNTIILHFQLPLASNTRNQHRQNFKILQADWTHRWSTIRNMMKITFNTSVHTKKSCANITSS